VEAPSVAAGARRSLFTELLAHLAVVMVAATGLLAVVLVANHETRSGELLGRALAAEARAPGPLAAPLVAGTRWWTVAPDGTAVERGAAGAEPHPIDAQTRALAAEARVAGASLLRVGGDGDAVRFALPLDAAGRVAVARLPADAALQRGLAPGAVALAVLAADAAIFTAFGATLLRRRVVLPLRRLAAAARAIADGERGARVPVEGSREAAEVASAFNEMTAALEGRSDALEKAVADLRAANASLRNAEAGLARAERLAAVGRLAAGVAHEVGNPMGALLAFLELVERDPALGAESRDHLARAKAQVDRVRTILRQLLDFSRPLRGAPAALDLRCAAQEAVGLVAAQRRWSALAIALEEIPPAPAAWADPGAVAQILLNLVLNAADAAGAQGRAGRLRIVVRAGALVRRPGDDPAAPAPRRRPDAVECWVLDDGPGVAPEDAERIFDPFFTTKPPSEGTGLGLANAVRLAEEQGGALELAQAHPEHGGEPLGGAAFVLRLPAAPASAEACAVRTGLRSAAPGRGPEAGGDPQAER